MTVAGLWPWQWVLVVVLGGFSGYLGGRIHRPWQLGVVGEGEAESGMAPRFGLGTSDFKSAGPSGPCSPLPPAGGSSRLSFHASSEGLLPTSIPSTAWMQCSLLHKQVSSEPIHGGGSQGGCHSN